MFWLSSLELLLKGLILGFLSSIPLGPIGVICIQRTLGKGRLSGFVSGLGAASADTLLAIVAGLGLSFIIDFISGNSFYFTLIGGLIVIFIGAQIFFKSPKTQFRERHNKKPPTLHTDYLSVLALTLSNPLAVFLFIAIFAGLNIVNGDFNIYAQLFIFTGIFLGSSLWWFSLTSIVNIYRDKFKIRKLWWLNKITGIIIFLFGLIALVSILFS